MKEIKDRVYVAGSYTADKIGCTRTAIDMGYQLLKRGYNPYIPHLTALMELCHPDLGYEDYLKWDFKWLAQCHYLLRLPGHSPGADREEVFAQSKKIPIVHSIEELPPL